jgi:hypothetical protein
MCPVTNRPNLFNLDGISPSFDAGAGFTPGGKTTGLYVPFYNYNHEE